MGKSEPAAGRPYMPGYGIVGPDEGGGLLPWAWAEDRLTRAREYWLATVGRTGAPHVMPVWGVWVAPSVWFSCSPGSRKARNLSADARATVATDDPREPVVVEGTCVRVTDEPAVADFTRRVNDKYETTLSVSFFTDNAVFRLEAARVFALDEGNFQGSPTRWVLDGGR